MQKSVVAVVLLLGFMHLSAEAKDLYVNNSGTPACSESTTYANNSPSNPWCSIHRASKGTPMGGDNDWGQAAKAGDTVYITAGTYHGTATNNRFTPLYNPANSGTLGNPIVFVAAEGGVVLTHSGFGPSIGSNLRNYVEWRGPFIINTDFARTKSDTGAVTFFAQTGSVVDGAILDGGWHTASDGASPIAIASSSPGNPGTITTTTPHGLSTGHYVYISGHTGSTPNLNGGSQSTPGMYRVTSTGSNTFTIQHAGALRNVNISAGGIGGTAIRLRDDNTSGIRCEDATNLIVRNVQVRRFVGYVNIRNSAGFLSYRCGGVLIEHSLFEENGTGIFLKGGFPNETSHSNGWSTGWTIRYNLIRNQGRNFDGAPQGIGISFGNNAAGTAAAPVRVYQNVIINAYDHALEWFHIDNLNRWNEPHYVYAMNNTLIGGSIGDRSAVRMSSSLMANSSSRFWNNVVAGTWGEAINWGVGAVGSAVESRFDPEHNVYHNLQTKFGSAQGTNYSTLNSWRSAFPSFDQAVPASITSDPSFIDGVAGDYRLSPNSPARNLGVDFLDLDGNGSTTNLIPAGAYITGHEIIGPTGASSPPPTPAAPSPPTGVRIIQ